MIKTDLKKKSKLFLQSLSKKSEKTYASYEDGLYPLIFYFEEYYEDDSRSNTVRDIAPEDIDHILSYFVIRKFLEGASYRVKTAKSIKAFFKYLAISDMYDKQVAKTIANMADYYKNQYPRLGRLESCLWDDTEGEIDQIMLLPKKQQQAKIEQLKESMVGAISTEPGYVEINKIEGNMVYGAPLLSDENVGPVKLGEKSISILEIGDIINMITIQQKKDEPFWEIAELGYVYPGSYFKKLRSQTKTPSKQDN